MTGNDRSHLTNPPKRVRVAQALALVALGAALVGAMGPSERVSSTYSWPPKTLPDGSPDRVWYAPLLLIRHQPESISASLPCTDTPTLPAVGRSVNVLSTARRPARAGALSVVRADGRLTISIGDRTLDRVRVTARTSGDESCSYRVTIAGERWSVEGGADGVTRGGVVDGMPVVYGLFSELDLRAATPVSVDVTTAVHATRTITSQAVAWTIAACAIATALLLLVGIRPRPWATLRGSARAALAHAHPVDAAVLATLLGWWVLSPSFVDDGWVAAREEMFATSRGFSHYYTSFGSNLPLDYWVEWLQHWLVQSTSALVLARLPSLALLAAAWVLCRWIAARVLASSTGTSSVALWALASTFLVGALAWGMTLRPEPVTALLVTAVVACMVRFRERETIAPLAATAVLVPLALTAHPAGIVVLAPVLACSPKLIGFARAQPPIASTIVASSIALLTVLAVVGADLEQRRADAQATVDYSHSVAWRYELIRYTALADAPWGTPLRRASVTLIALAVIAFALWGRRRRRDLLDFPATALIVALVLLIATPSKHPWHFGALLGLAAVAVASETARLRHRSARSRRWQAQPFLVLAGAILVILWSWAPRHAWSAEDLRTVDWTPSFEPWPDVSTLAWALPLVLLAAIASKEIARGRRDSLPEVPWRAVSWTAPVLAVPLIAFTVAVLVADAAKTEGWTLMRQNLATLRGDAGCGLANDLLVADPGSARPSPVAGGEQELPQLAWMPPPPREGMRRFALGPTNDGRTASPWFALANRSFGLFIAGTPGPSELVLTWGRRVADGIESLGSDPILLSFELEIENVVPHWRLLAAGELPDPPEGAHLVRIVLHSANAPGPAVAVTAPVAYDHRPLAPRLRSAGSRTLVVPNVLAYFPCVVLPRLGDGIVDVPDNVVLTRDAAWLHQERDTSPFLGVTDLYSLHRLSVADSPLPPRDVIAVYAVDKRIPGGVEAAPSKTTSRS